MRASANASTSTWKNSYDSVPMPGKGARGRGGGCAATRRCCTAPFSAPVGGSAAVASVKLKAQASGCVAQVEAPR